jgi:hypothetical protein
MLLEIEYRVRCAKQPNWYFSAPGLVCFGRGKSFGDILDIYIGTKTLMPSYFFGKIFIFFETSF